MSTVTAPHTRTAETTETANTADNRMPYLSWGLAWLVGHGAFALAEGPRPFVAMPAALPGLLLVAGLVIAAAVTLRRIVIDSRGQTGDAKLTGTLLGGTWLVGFTTLFLLITRLAGSVDHPLVETLLWPAGSGLVIGVCYLAGGTATRDLLQYAFGCWLALVTGASLLLDTPSTYAVLAVLGSAGYLAAAVLEPHRRALAGAHATESGQS